MKPGRILIICSEIEKMREIFNNEGDIWIGNRVINNDEDWYIDFKSFADHAGSYYDLCILDDYKRIGKIERDNILKYCDKAYMIKYMSRKKFEDVINFERWLRVR